VAFGGEPQVPRGPGPEEAAVRVLLQQHVDQLLGLVEAAGGRAGLQVLPGLLSRGGVQVDLGGGAGREGAWLQDGDGWQKPHEVQYLMCCDALCYNIARVMINNNDNNIKSNIKQN